MTKILFKKLTSIYVVGPQDEEGEEQPMEVETARRKRAYHDDEMGRRAEVCLKYVKYFEENKPDESRILREDLGFD